MQKVNISRGRLKRVLTANMQTLTNKFGNLKDEVVDIRSTCGILSDQLDCVTDLHSEFSELASKFGDLRNEMADIQATCSAIPDQLESFTDLPTKVGALHDRVDSMFGDLRNEIADIHATCSTVPDQLESLTDLPTKVGILHDRVDSMFEQVSDSNSKRDVDFLSGWYCSLFSTSSMMFFFSEMKLFRETMHKELTASLESIVTALQTAVAEVTAVASSSQVCEPKQRDRFKCIRNTNIYQTPALTSLKRKRFDDEEEGERDDSTADIQALPDTHDSRTIGQASDAITTIRTDTGVCVPARKRTRRFATAAAQTVTAITVGAVLTWSALAFS